MPLTEQQSRPLAGFVPRMGAFAAARTGRAMAPLFAQPLQPKEGGLAWGGGKDCNGLGWAGKGGSGAPKTDGRLPRLGVIKSVNLRGL